MSGRPIPDDEGADSLAPEEAAGRAVDSDALLQGEDPDTPHLDDAEHWISVYVELIQFKESVIAASHDQIAELEHDVSRDEAQTVDVTILEAELARFRRRLAYWDARRRLLAAEAAS